MSKYAIRVSELSKEYVIGDARFMRPTLRDVIASKMAAPWTMLSGRGRAAEEKFMALDNVSFDVEQGDVLGIIGRNGAGKSTLLKVLARITAPTSGRAEIHGRIASLLEVGTGFHPELSGRENIYLNGAILGMSRAEITRKFDEIVDFSGVEKFLETPVKRYSSGMYVRLAFAVAAHLDPEILIIDEVLAVGDAEFQKKCLGRMGQIAKGGRTVLFVSHNVIAVRNLCTRAILLNSGAIAADGSVEHVLSVYLNSSMQAQSTHLSLGNEVCDILRVSVNQDDTEFQAPLSAVKPFAIDIDIMFKSPGDYAAHISIISDDGSRVLSSGSFFHDEGYERAQVKGLLRYRCEIPGYFLNDGNYILDLHVLRDRRDVVLDAQSAIQFTVQDDFPAQDGWTWRPHGVTRPKLVWSSSYSPKAVAPARSERD